MDCLKMAYARARYLGLGHGDHLGRRGCPFPARWRRSTSSARCWTTPSKAMSTPTASRNAYAKSARTSGAEVYRATAGRGPAAPGRHLGRDHRQRKPSHAEHVGCNCGGLWAREVGRMVGLELPVLAMEHMYLITEDMPEDPRLSRVAARSCCTSSISRARSTCARSARAC